MLVRRLFPVEIRPLFGKGKLAQVVAVLGWTKANTSAIERFNLTDRMCNVRKAHKTLRFARRTDRLLTICYGRMIRTLLKGPRHRAGFGILSIVPVNAAGDLQNLGSYLNTNSGRRRIGRSLPQSSPCP